MFYGPCESSSTLVVGYHLLKLCFISRYFNLHTAMQVKVMQTNTAMQVKVMQTILGDQGRVS